MPLPFPSRPVLIFAAGGIICEFGNRQSTWRRCQPFWLSARPDRHKGEARSSTSIFRKLNYSAFKVLRFYLSTARAIYGFVEPHK